MVSIARLSFALAVTLLLAGCATSSHVLVGTARAPISPDQVRIYTDPPPKYERIALLDSSSRHSFALTDQQKTDKAIARMKEEAAKLGANGVLLQGLASQQSGSIGFGLGSASYGASSAVSTGVGTSGGLYSKVASGTAIYVAE
jgi:uncharacterized lipoprotein YajG